MEAYEYVCHMDHAGSIAETPSDEKQKVATACASRILGPISRDLMAQNHTDDL